MTFIAIDQLKANMTMQSRFQPDDEKTTGVWNNTKSATGSYSFHHMVSQWLYFSKGSDISLAKFPSYGINGWMINCFTEKNKNTASRYKISIPFDKRNGLQKFWAEYIFLSDYTLSEKELIKGGVGVDFPLAITTSGAFSKLEVVNSDTGEVEWTSKSFYKKDALSLYQNDKEFHDWFEKAVSYSCKKRITEGLLRVNTTSVHQQDPLIEEEPKEEPKKSRKKKTVIAPSTEETELENLQLLEE